MLTHQCQVARSISTSPVGLQLFNKAFTTPGFHCAALTGGFTCRLGHHPNPGLGLQSTTPVQGGAHNIRECRL